MLGTDILVVPAFAKNLALPKDALYWYKGDVWEFQNGDYKKFSFKSELKDGRNMIVNMMSSEGSGWELLQL